MSDDLHEHEADGMSTEAGVHEQLVAYLDGELDDEQIGQVEAMLASDPKVRETLTHLEKAWDALEHLERAEVDETFTQSTLEMVAVAAEGDVRRRQEDVPRRRRRRRLIGAGSVAAAALAGYLAGALFWHDADEELLEVLPVLENLDQYRQIDDFEFLKLLSDEGLFAEVDNET